MAKELLREGKIESPSSPATHAVGDQRTYLYIEVDKDTAEPRQSFFSWHGGVTLTPSQSQATLLSASRLATLPAEVPVSPAEALRENRLMTATRHER